MNKQSLSERAINLLARREHSRKELLSKLRNAGFDLDDIERQLDTLIQSGLQSDQRFSQSYLYYRSQRGFGSQRIKMELKERGIDNELIADSFNEADIDWFSLAIIVRCKRFGEQSPDEYKDRVKQQRFLHSRGFTHEQITESFNTESI